MQFQLRDTLISDWGILYYHDYLVSFYHENFIKLSYINSNLVGFSNILEGCRHNGVKHLIYASSSSVYGGNSNMPFSESKGADHPISLYAATKRANELIAHSYSHIYGLPSTGLRFFTVYGPWGRPDMAPMIFTSSILSNEAINIFNDGKLRIISFFNF